MKKTSLVLALAVSISGISPLLANEVEQQTKQNVEGIVQQDQEYNAQPETKETPTNTNVDWTKPGMQLSDWEYDENTKGKRILKRYIGESTDTIYVPAFFNAGSYPDATVTVFNGNILEGSMIKDVKIVNHIGDAVNSKWVEFGDPVKEEASLGTLKIPDNSVVKTIEFIGGTNNICFDGSIKRTQNGDFTDIIGFGAPYVAVFGNVNINSKIDTLRTDLRSAQYINARSVEIIETDNRRINPNPLYMQAEDMRYRTVSGEWINIMNHYQLNQLLDGMGIKSTMQLKLDANGGNGGVVIHQPVFFVNSLTEEQQKQIYQNEQNLDACIRIAFLENPTYYPTLEGRTFLGWEKQPTNTRAVADAFNQTYLAKWSEPTSQPTVTPTQPNQQTPVQQNNQAPVPTTTVSTASNNRAMELIAVVLIGSIGLLSLRRWR